MKIWQTGVHSSPLNPFQEGVDTIREKKIFYGAIFGSTFSSFFEDRSYGSGVKEISYKEYCLKDGYKDELLHYGPKRKIIGCVIVEDWASVLAMNTEEYGQYRAKLYLEGTRHFSGLPIKDFDSSAFLDDLITYFRKHSLIE